MTERITIEELKRRVEDPSVPEEAIRPYVLEDPENSEAFEPVLRPNPALVEGVTPLEADVFLGFLNGASRRKRERRYRERLASGYQGLRIVSEGDSWFQYPLLLRDVIDHLSDRYAILSLGAAGALLADMIAADEIPEALKRERADVLLLSGGGNDMVGDDRIAQMLHPGGGHHPDDTPNAAFARFLDQITGLYRGLFERMADEFPELRIVVHGYDRAIPARGKWLGRPMEAIGIADGALQKAIVAVLINRFNERLGNLASEFPGRVAHVDCRGAVGDHRWHDELHPIDAGYLAVARRFERQIEA